MRSTSALTIAVAALTVGVGAVAACHAGQGEQPDSGLGGDSGAVQSADAQPQNAADAGFEPTSLRIATANLRCLIEDWDRRVVAIAQEIADVSPEVIALQEVCREPGGRDSLSELLQQLEQIGGGRFEAVHADTHWAWDQYDEGIAVAVRVPILDSRIVELPTGVFPRKAIVVRVQSSTGPLVFAGTHLSFGAEQSLVRHSQLGVVRDAVAAMRQPGDVLAIAGDFNETPGSLAVSAALGAGYSDAWATVRPSEPGPTVPASAPEARIDFLLTNGLSAMSAGQFMDTPHQGVWPSDHRGVWAEVLTQP